MRVLLVSDGSGGHLIPALQVAQALARHGVRPTVWYAHRPRIAALAERLSQTARAQDVEVAAIPLAASGWPEKLWHCGQLWHRAQQWFDAMSPEVVVGFGGWVSGPVLLAARQRGIGCLVHEQNVQLGRANRWLRPWVDRVAVSFEETQSALKGTPSFVTGLPVRQEIGRPRRAETAAWFGLDPSAPTLVVLGGSQGARAVNRLMMQVALIMTDSERQEWQIVHLTGAADESAVRAAYAAAGLRAWTAAHVAKVETLYAIADVAVARAGASTIAELARCGLPAILIPYPHAGAHQRANAQLITAHGGGIFMEESNATPKATLGALRLLLGDERVRTTMGLHMRAMSRDDAAERLSAAILRLAEEKSPGRPRPAAALSLSPEPAP